MSPEQAKGKRVDRTRLALEGAPTAVALGETAGLVESFDLYENGTLLFRRAPTAPRQSLRLLWVDRSGEPTPIDLPPGRAKASSRAAAALRSRRVVGPCAPWAVGNPAVPPADGSDLELSSDICLSLPLPSAGVARYDPHRESSARAVTRVPRARPAVNLAIFCRRPKRRAGGKRTARDA